MPKFTKFKCMPCQNNVQENVKNSKMQLMYKIFIKFNQNCNTPPHNAVLYAYFRGVFTLFSDTNFTIIFAHQLCSDYYHSKITEVIFLENVSLACPEHLSIKIFYRNLPKEECNKTSIITFWYSLKTITTESAICFLTDMEMSQVPVQVRFYLLWNIKMMQQVFMQLMFHLFFYL